MQECMSKAQEMITTLTQVMDGLGFKRPDNTYEPAFGLSQIVKLALPKATVLGSGHYGMAIALSDDRVLKIATSLKDGYPTYIRWVAQQPRTIGLPRVFAHGDTGHFFWCILPMLRPLGGKGLEVMELINSDSAGYLPTQFRRIVDLLGVGGFCRVDMHDANVMYDTELGEYVITDPVADLYCGTDKAMAWLHTGEMDVKYPTEHVASDLFVLAETQQVAAKLDAIKQEAVKTGRIGGRLAINNIPKGQVCGGLTVDQADRAARCLMFDHHGSHFSVCEVGLGKGFDLARWDRVSRAVCAYVLLDDVWLACDVADLYSLHFAGRLLSAQVIRFRP